MGAYIDRGGHTMLCVPGSSHRVLASCYMSMISHLQQIKLLLLFETDDLTVMVLARSSQPFTCSTIAGDEPLL
jgi:hypothetical protein